MPSSFINPLYTEPGVSVKETVTPSIAPLIATSDAICLVGPASGSIAASEIFRLGSDTPTANAYTLQNVPSDATNITISSIKAVDPAVARLSNPNSTIAADISVGTTTINLAAGGGASFPSSGAFKIYIDNEEISVTSRSTDALSVTATTAAHSAGAKVYTYGVDAGFSTGATNSVALSNSNKTLTRIAAAATGQLTSGRAPVIPDGEYVQVNYTYVPADYYAAQSFDNMSNIEEKFGAKYNATRDAILSPLSFAAQLAFENGATSVIIQPLFKEVNGVRTQPTNADVTDPTITWSPTLNALKNYEGIGIIVPVIGQCTTSSLLSKVCSSTSPAAINDQNVIDVFNAVMSFIDSDLLDNGQYHIAVFGEDGTESTYASRSTLQNHAVILQGRFADDTGISKYAENCVLLNTSKFKRPLPTGSGKLDIGGQFAAAGIAGMLGSRKVSSTLTRKNLTGFSDVTTSLSRKAKTEDSSRGLFVIEQKGFAIQVRHALTLNTKGVDKSELSVVRAKHRVINSLKYTIDSQIIGTVVADNNAPLIVAAAVGGVLSTMVDDDDIVSFSDVQAKTLTLNPTVIEVRFAYRPAFPVNYVNIAFSIDLNSGDLTVNETQNQVNSGVLNG